MKPETLEILKSLPADAKGLTQRMTMHLNFGRQGGAATFTIHDSDGNTLPITRQYDSREEHKYEGFFILDDAVEQCFPTWKLLYQFIQEEAARAEGTDTA